MSVLSAIVGNNCDLFPNILSLYAKEGSTIADVTWGRGVFWKKVNKSLYNLLRSDLLPVGDIVADARSLPYDKKSLDMVVFDPPYMHWHGSTSELKETNPVVQYGNGVRTTTGIKSWRDVLGLYHDMAKEAHRVVVDCGYLIIKVQDTVASSRQRWLHCDLMSLVGWECVDLFVLVQSTKPAHYPKWRNQFHARKNHSFFIVHRKLA